MDKIIIKDILGVINGTLLFGNIEETLDSFSINTKEINEDDIFIGMKGDNVDGSKFYMDAFNNGAKGAIINKGFYDHKEIDNKFIIEVDDTVDALQKLAKYKRDMLNDIIIVGVTGSVGKTSTKRYDRICFITKI